MNTVLLLDKVNHQSSCVNFKSVLKKFVKI